MIFLQFSALFVIYAGSLAVMILLLVTVVAVLGAVCVNTIRLLHRRSLS